MPRLYLGVLGCRHAGRASDGRAYRPCTRRLYVLGAPSHGGGGECPRSPIARSLPLTAAPPLSHPAWTRLGVFSPRASCTTQVFPGCGWAPDEYSQPVGQPRICAPRALPSLPTDIRLGVRPDSRELNPPLNTTMGAGYTRAGHCRLRHSLFVAMLPCTPLTQYTNTSALPFPVCS